MPPIALDALISLLHRRVTDPAVIAVVAAHGQRADYDPSGIMLPPHGIGLGVFRDSVDTIELGIRRQVHIGRYAGTLWSELPRRSKELTVMIERDGLEVWCSYERGTLDRVHLRRPRAVTKVRKSKPPTFHWRQLQALVGVERNDPALVSVLLATARQTGLDPNILGLWGHGASLVMAKQRVREVRLHVAKLPRYQGTWKGALPPETTPDTVFEYARKLKLVRFV